VASYITRQLGLPLSDFYEYDWQGRTSKRYRSQIREFLGFRKWSRRYSNRLVEWLLTNILPEQFKHEQLKEAALLHLRNPYGIFQLDMDSRIPIESSVREMA